MTITKEKSIDQITIVEDGTVLYREVTKIVEDGKVISQSFHRTSLVPGQDTQDVPQKVVDICNTVWTNQVVTNYKTSIV